MISKVLKSASSVSFPLNYNEKKVLIGMADVVLVNGIEENDVVEREMTLLNYENNPNIRNNVRKFAFHAVHSKWEHDSLSENEMLEYIQEWIERMGYAQQPYIVYRHSDTNDLHYHIVSVRVDKNGKVLNDSYEAFRCNNIMNELSVKYNFVPGEGSDKSIRLASDEIKKELIRQGKINPSLNIKTSNTELETMVALSKAFDANIRSEKDFHIVLNFLGYSFNSKTISDYRDLQYVKLFKDNRSKPIILTKEKLEVDMDTELSRAIQNGKAAVDDDVIDHMFHMCAVAKVALNNSSSFKHMNQILSDYHMIARLDNTESGDAELSLYDSENNLLVSNDLVEVISRELLLLAQNKPEKWFSNDKKQIGRHLKLSMSDIDETAENLKFYSLTNTQSYVRRK